MRIQFLIHGCLVLALTAGCSSLEPVRSSEHSTQPFGLESPWIARPSTEASIRITPLAALASGQLQQVWLRCQIADGGMLSDCEIDHESQQGIGLGRAAIEAARLCSLKPKLANGTTSKGRFVSVGMVFDTGGAAGSDHRIYPILSGIYDTKPAPAVVGVEAHVTSEPSAADMLQRLDMTSFRNSLQPSRAPGKKHPADWSFTSASTRSGQSYLTRLDSGRQDWVIGLKIIRRDAEGAIACFSDEALGYANYRAYSAVRIVSDGSGGYRVTAEDLDEPTCQPASGQD